MTYDFTRRIDRTGLDALALDAIHLPAGVGPDAPQPGFDFIPMWIADMNFETLPAISQAIAARAQHPLFGYFVPSKDYYQKIAQWHLDRHQVEGIKNAHISYHNGVLGGVLTAMRVLASRGDKVLLHSPTYVGFTQVLANNGYDMVHSALYQDQAGVWRMDYEDMEAKIIEHKIHVAIFCSPHNPTGRVWQEWEIKQAMDIFEKHQVFVISDEIWSDLVLQGQKHIPSQTISDYGRQHTLALYAPSKTFNLAGLVGAYSITYNQWLTDRMTKEASLTHYNSMNVLSMHAQNAAYSKEGQAWLEDLLVVIEDNIDLAIDFINQKLDGVTVTKPQGTYMIFIDCSDYLRQKGLSMSDLIKRGWDYGVGWQSGEAFHAPNHIRLNLALPTSQLQEALDRLAQYVFV